MSSPKYVKHPIDGLFLRRDASGVQWLMAPVTEAIGGYKPPTPFTIEGWLNRGDVLASSTRPGAFRLVLEDADEPA